MCSVNGEFDDGQEFIPDVKSRLSGDVLCQKCKVEKGLVLLRGKDLYCDACFLAGATHKFRATLGRSKIVRPADQILVAHSGKAASTALLHLIKAGMHESVHKRLVFRTKVLYIDDAVIKGRCTEERRKTIFAIRDQVAPLGFETYALSLSQCFDADPPKVYTLEQLSNSLEDLAERDEKLKKIMLELADTTSQLDLVKILRRKLLVAASRELDCSKVFLANDCSSLATDILSNIALGKGAHLSLDVGFLDTRFTGVTLLRPMRDFSRYEIATYLDIRQLAVAEESEKPLHTSIQGLTEKFVNDLETRFGGTVSTVFRTGEKVSCVANKSQSSNEKCVLCNAPLDTATVSDTEISAMRATAFSKFISVEGPNGHLQEPSGQITKLSLGESESYDSCGKCNVSCAKASEVPRRPKALQKFLCYGCSLILRDAENLDLSRHLLDKMRENQSLDAMREEIKNFLL